MTGPKTLQTCLGEVQKFLKIDNFPSKGHPNDHHNIQRKRVKVIVNQKFIFNLKQSLNRLTL